MKHVKDTEHTDIDEHDEKRRLRRMSDILPVSLQDILHRGKPDLRAEEIVNRS